MAEIIEIKHDLQRGFISVIIDNTVVGQMTFVFTGVKKLIIDHTQVDIKYNGRGYGKMLLAKAVDFASENQLKIIPLCPFAKKVIDNTLEYNDVLY